MLAAEIPPSVLSILESDPIVATVALAETQHEQIINSVPALGAAFFWASGLTARSESVAVLDSGVNWLHRWFGGSVQHTRFVANGGLLNCLLSDDLLTDLDLNGHGTQVAGIIASQASAGFTNYLAVAHGVSTIYCVKVGCNAVSSLFPEFASEPADVLSAVNYVFFNSPATNFNYSSVSWVVYDNRGHGDGVGSRGFTVWNTGTGNVPSSEGPIESASNQAVTLSRGFHASRRAEVLTLKDTGEYSIDIEELERMELQLGATSGYLVGNGERRDLPVGSSLEAGAFHWHVDPGFLGAYALEFERADGTTLRARMRIQPKVFSNQPVR
jgi:hypothetical protein